MLGELGAGLPPQKGWWPRCPRPHPTEHMPAAEAASSRPRRHRLCLGKVARGGVWWPSRGP
ncbi:hypothetical protein PR202_gb16852 [Eleusine coracana subsp. coracana]|uniref:Uncharacterized protein n=1 Tax=Eleusine coracana subsp. coracana TaxID=191504 RepID=A0AAV5F2X3_ELECO|nr:hypothetical protein PR202_gb16852 [Eleusine coracana subsp. coracana]